MDRGLGAEAIVQEAAGQWLTFTSPVLVLEACTPPAVAGVLADVERLTRDNGWFAAGFLAYEAAAAFGLPCGERRPEIPLAWFGLFEPASVAASPELPAAGRYQLGDVEASLDFDQFRAAFEAIKGHLAAGNTYQVNFTFSMRAAFAGDPRGLFADLVRAQRGRYSAYIAAGELAICSASPELFFSLDGMCVRARPMKGTAPRGLTLDADAARRDELRASEKQRAENVMIVDMMRNDLGRIADIGSVRVSELFTVEPYPNVWQMTSTVTATSRASLEQLFAALHPCASVTGAPKRRTMDIIRALEREPRGVYTGAIGYIRPDGNGHFNVAIRTALVARDAGEVTFGVGSGIVWDSDAAAEYAECLAKASVITQAAIRFELLETTAWTPASGFAHLERHLSRMRSSAEHFQFAYADDRVRSALAQAVQGACEPQRVRWRLSRGGDVRVETQQLTSWTGGVMSLGFAHAPVDRTNRFLFHKTTHRAIYESFRRTGVDEVVLWNAHGHVTEATTANIVAQLDDGTVATPPVSCGLLAGTARAALLEEGGCVEREITLDELRAARTIWLTNSVHGRREARLVPDGGRR